MAQPEGEFTDVESLLANSVTKLVDQAKPQFEEGGQVRKLLEDRVELFQDRAKNFILGELNTTATKLLKAIEADEAAIVLDFNNAVESSFPPVPVMLAGLMSPTILTLNGISHTVQLGVVFAPLLVGSAWAVYTDYGAVCNIPSMVEWIYTAFFISLLLTLGHLSLMSAVNGGKAALKAKSDEIRERLEHNAADGEIDFNDMQEIFIGHNVLVQKALLTEDEIRRSFWHDVVGMGTAIWLLVVIWNWVVVIGWTFLPHQVAFHEKAAIINGQPNPEYCGAWASVFVARIVCMVAPLFFLLNVFQVIHWITQSLVNHPGFSKTMLSVADSADRGMTGLPVIQQIVKAFVLRGSTEVKPAALTVAASEQVRLQHEHAEVVDQLAAIEGKIKAAKRETKVLKKKADKSGGAGMDGMLQQLNAVQGLSEADWQSEGKKLVGKASAEAEKAQMIATEELDRLSQQLMDAAEFVQNHEVVKRTIAQAREAAEKAQKAAEQAKVEAERLAVEAQQKAEELAKVAQEQAQQLADQLPDAEEMNRMAAQAQAQAQAGMAQAQAQAQAGMAQAQAGVAQAQVQAQAGMAQAQAQAQAGMAQAKSQADSLTKK